MKKLINKVLAVGMSAMLSVCCIPTLALADENDGVPYAPEGWTQIGNSLMWQINDSNGILEISTLEGIPESSAPSVNFTEELGQAPSSAASWPWHSDASRVHEVSITKPFAVYGSIDYMFEGLSNATNFSTTNMNTVNATSMNSLFKDCSSLTDSGAGGFNDTNNFVTSNVTNMESIFEGCLSLTNINLDWATQNVSNMSNMFAGCSSLTTLTLGNNFNTSNCSSSGNVFPSNLNTITVGPDFTLFSQLPATTWYNKNTGAAHSTTDGSNWGAGTYTTIAPPKAQSISLSETSKTLTLDSDNTFTLVATLEPATSSDVVTFTSSAPSVATVNASGVVTAVGEGTATITAGVNDSDDVKATCEVTVVKSASDIVYVESVTLDKTELILVGDQTEELIATVLPAEATPAGVVWSSSNDEVATVDNGAVTPVGKGECTITATSVGTNKMGEKLTATCSVTVLNPVNTVSVDIPNVIRMNTPVELEAIVSGVLGTDTETPAFEWSESTEDYGTLTAIEGTNKATFNPTKMTDNPDDLEFIITVTSPGVNDPTTNETIGSGYAIETYQISITYPKPASVTLSETTKVIPLGSAPFALTAEVTPVNADDPVAPTSWESSDEEVATVDNKGMVTIVGLGEAEITATAGGISATCTITVTKPDTVPINSISFDEESVTLTGQETVKLGVTIDPSTATPKDLVWSSSDENVVTVSDEGYVTSTGKGEATITASSQDGTKTATCTITVMNPAKEIIANVPSLMKLGAMIQLQASLIGDLPGETDGASSYAWNSLDSSVAKVTANEEEESTATLEAVALGNTEIIVSAMCGQTPLTTSLSIEVANPDVESVSIEPSELKIVVGSEPVALTATVLPVIEPAFEVSWKSSDASVASVDEAGVVTPNSVGDAVITAMSEGKSATCKVNVAPLTLDAATTSQYPGYLTISDAVTAQTLNGLSLEIVDSTKNASQELQDLAVKTAGAGSKFVEAFDIELVDAAGTEVPWSDPEHSVIVSISAGEAVISLFTQEAKPGFYYINDELTKAEAMPSWVSNDTVAFETTHFSTYALTAIPAASSDGNKDNTNVGNDNQKGLARTGDMLLSAATAPLTGGFLGIVLAMLIIALRRQNRESAEE